MRAFSLEGGDFVMQTVGAPQLWARLCEAMKRPELAEDPRFATPMARRLNWPPLRDIILKWLDGFVTREEAKTAHKMMGGEMREHRFVQSGTPSTPHLDRNAMFDRMDTNHDGMISRQEFALNGHVPGTPEGPTRLIIARDEHAPGGLLYHRQMGMHGRMFEMADANRDGRLSLQEMTDAALRHFDMADANHDGRITPDERMQMHQRMKEMKRPA